MTARRTTQAKRGATGSKASQISDAPVTAEGVQSVPFENHLQRIIDDPNTSARDRMAAIKARREISALDVAEGVTLNRLSREDLEQLTARLARSHPA